MKKITTIILIVILLIFFMPKSQAIAMDEWTTSLVSLSVVALVVIIIAGVGWAESYHQHLKNPVNMEQIYEQREFYIKIDSEPKNVKIEINGELLGYTPLAVTFTGKTSYEIVAYPTDVRQFMQKHTFIAFYDIPDKIFFNMFINPESEKKANSNFIKQEMIKLKDLNQ